ncbi:hypothetical protein Vretimale_7599, partial [Volvox reticuliferus]
QQEAAAAGAAVAARAGEDTGATTAVAAPMHRGRSNSKRHLNIHREPLHPNWLLGNRRAAMIGGSNRGWLPLHVLAQAQAQAHAQLALSASSPRSMGCETGGDTSNTATAPSSPLLSQQQQQQLLQQPLASVCGSLASPLLLSGGGVATTAATASCGSGGGTNSRASSTHSDRMTRSAASGLGSPSPLPRVDSLTGASPFASLTSLQHLAQSGFVMNDRDRDRDREEAPGALRLGPMQGLLRGSRMQGHVTAVANPAYVAAAAAATAAITAAVGGVTCTSPATGVAAATSIPAAGSGPALGAPAVLLREHSRRQRLLNQQLSLESEASTLGAEASLAGRIMPLQVPAFSASSTTTTAGSGSGGGGGGGGGGSGGGALRPSLAQQRDTVAAAAAAAAVNGPPRPTPTTTVVAAGVQGHAVTLRPGSPYQTQYAQTHTGHQHHHHSHGVQQGGPAAIDTAYLSQLAAHAQAIAAAAATASLGGSTTGATGAPWPQSYSQRYGSSNSSYNPSQQQQQQQQQAQVRSLGSQHRRPSLTGFGNARAQLQHRSTDGWMPLLSDTGSGG